ncbi:MAG: hypothetical protein ACHQ7M_18785, partial [Chloroflexota bacterium]
IYSTLAEAVPEDYGQSPPAPAYLRGSTCPAVVTLLFKHEHGRLAVELPKLNITRVRLEGRSGLAVLSFGKLPERQIRLAREGHVWKIQSLHLYVNFQAPYEEGWARLKPGEGLKRSQASIDMPPDRPSTVVYKPFPDVFVPPFHGPNPVTGKPVEMSK